MQNKHKEKQNSFQDTNLPKTKGLMSLQRDAIGQNTQMKDNFRKKMTTKLCKMTIN